jgi:hypothetical protein
MYWDMELDIGKQVMKVETIIVVECMTAGC